MVEHANVGLEKEKRIRGRSWQEHCGALWPSLLWSGRSLRVGHWHVDESIQWFLILRGAEGFA